MTIHVRRPKKPRRAGAFVSIELDPAELALAKGAAVRGTTVAAGVAAVRGRGGSMTVSLNSGEVSVASCRGACIAAPQLKQNALPSLTAAPHFGQIAIFVPNPPCTKSRCTRDPQSTDGS